MGELSHISSEFDNVSAMTASFFSCVTSLFNMCLSILRLRGCLVASHNLPHFTLGKFDQVGKCLVHN